MSTTVTFPVWAFSAFVAIGFSVVYIVAFQDGRMFGRQEKDK